MSPIIIAVVILLILIIGSAFWMYRRGASVAPSVDQVTLPVDEVTMPVEQSAPVAPTAPAAPVGSVFKGVFGAPGLAPDNNMPLGHVLTGQLGCTEACPAKCMSAVSQYYPGGSFAVTSTGGCRGGPDAPPFDTAGPAEWGQENSWALYDM
jgi:hypothetical protein